MAWTAATRGDYERPRASHASDVSDREWVLAPPGPSLFKIVSGTMQRLADMTVVRPSPPPLALSWQDALREALERAGFDDVSIVRLALLFRAPVGKFAGHVRSFAARADMIPDKQPDPVLHDICASWDEQLAVFVVDEAHEVPMPSLAVSADRKP